MLALLLLFISPPRSLAQANGEIICFLIFPRPGFLEALLRAWVGPRPPSRDFPAAMVAAGAWMADSELFEQLAPGEDRIAAIAAWPGARLPEPEPEEDAIEPL